MAEYIEREAVMLQINIADFVRDDNYEAGATLLFQDDVVDRISSIPAADVRPVVRGRWITPPKNRDYAHMLDFYECPLCGYIEDCSVKFCPNCGADMREES